MNITEEGKDVTRQVFNSPEDCLKHLCTNDPNIFRGVGPFKDRIYRKMANGNVVKIGEMKTTKVK